MNKRLPTDEDLLRFLCGPGVPFDVQSVVNRYREISLEADKRLFVVPADKEILQKLIWPLRYAKGAYALGNYLGTIALCGAVVEMLTILTFEMSDAYTVKSGQTKPLTIEDQSLLFGSSFEKLTQERRVRVLRALGLIDEDIKPDFDIVRTIRRRYLHLYSQERPNIAQDAVRVFLATVGLVRATLGLGIKDGKVLLKPQVLRYLERKGSIPDRDDQSSLP